MPRWPSQPGTLPDPPPEPTEPAADRVGPEQLPAESGAVLTGLARAAIAAELGLSHPRVDVPAWARSPGASFVTLTTADGRLRGCIGSTSPVGALADDVRRNAVGAAVRDPRFTPLRPDELATTGLEVSVLSPTTPLPCRDEADALAQLRPGVDGVVLEYAGRRATFLPQVWDSLPDPADFLAGLRRKLGLPAGFWSPDLRLSRYVVAACHEPPAKEPS